VGKSTGATVVDGVGAGVTEDDVVLFPSVVEDDLLLVVDEVDLVVDEVDEVDLDEVDETGELEVGVTALEH